MMNLDQLTWCIREITGTIGTVEKVGLLIERPDGEGFFNKSEGIQFLTNLRDEFQIMHDALHRVKQLELDRVIEEVQAVIGNVGEPRIGLELMRDIIIEKGLWA